MLQLVHETVVDTAMFSCKFEPKRRRSLKDTALDVLGKAIQEGGKA
jgi:hypothetical protein